MRHINILLMIASALILSSCSSSDTFDERQEAAVYRACVNEYYLKLNFADSWFEGKPFNVIVVSDKTSGFLIPFSYRSEISKLSPKPDKTTIRSFLNRNDGEYPESQLNEKTLSVIGRYPINKYITFKIPHVLLNDQEMDEILSSQDEPRWDEFYRRYPTSRGIVFLSRVGFNRNMTQALLYFTVAVDSGSIEGYLFLFEKQSGGWKESARTLVWIS